jgi:hypothetical protein
MMATFIVPRSTRRVKWGPNGSFYKKIPVGSTARSKPEG